MKTLIFQGITEEDFFTKLERIVAENTATVSTTATGETLSRYIPEVNTEQAAGILGCSVSHLKILVQRHPEILKPIIRGEATVRYPTAAVWRLREKLDGEKARRKPALK